MRNLPQLMRRPVTTERLDASIGSKMAYGAGAVVSGVGMLKIAGLELTEHQLMFGLLLVTGVALQLVVLGMALEVRGQLLATGDRSR
ncbi:MAG: hypothetical protein HN742_43225 [Lentisphaerae bacterium]|jgi:hypothetical protein|nr:hypothetical protein [Lentisphaerota bacterium]MBT4815230.1 hypothetical protein [Lentisphaerota bacterium]MBT5606064.1 hypothetical protein [Lentisphaerota bacterium]MBT7060297.1 hypothetical protein [Lentisphaerota bacterium]MBT7848751.1 hypothetical protein [Lentisphaerota bacterium]